LIISTSEVQSNFGKYLKMAQYEEIIITKNGKKVAKLAPYTDDNHLGRWIVSEGSAAFKESSVRATFEEYLNITKESENRYEYIDGEIFLLASPSYVHQKAVGGIFGEFLAWFRGHKCEPLVSPFDVTLFRGEREENINVVQPDVIVICDPERIDEEGRYQGTPALVVEVLSDSTRNKDLIKKLGLYMESGVKEYWVVNTASAEIYVYAFAGHSINRILTFKGGERAESVVFPGLSIDLKWVFPD